MTRINTCIALLLSLFAINNSFAQPYICNFGGFGSPAAGHSRYITNFTITGGGINKSSAGTDGTYQNYTATIGSVSRGLTYNASISYSACAWRHYLGVYVDWNNSGTYDGGSETVVNNYYANTTSAGTYNFTISVPAGAALATVYMRIHTYDAANGVCAYSYGEAEDYKLTISAAGSAPTITATTAVSSITCSSGSSGGATINDGGQSITVKGICWNTSINPTTANSKTTDGGTGTANFTSSLSSLSAGTTYYVRAYATNAVGTGYGPNESFTTLSSTTAGSIGTAQTICSGSTPLSLTQIGAAGGGNSAYTYQWQSSSDDANWSSIGGATATTYTPGALTANTYYRRQATSSNCGTANTTSILMTINPASVGGSISSSASVCSGSNSGTLTLSGHTGSITKWQKNENGAGWTDIANTSTSQAYTNLTVTTEYRAVVKSGVCSSTNSSSATITVSPATVGGSVAGNSTVCSGTNSGTLSLSGHTGSVIRWESSTNNWGATTTIANTTTSQAYTNLTSTTKYRAVIQSGGCSAANSSEATITVTPTLNPGVIKF